MENRIIYKYLSLRDALKVILHKTLKFSQPDDFNDPFDSYEELLKFDITNKFIESHKKMGILHLDEADEKLSKKGLINSLKTNVYTFENEDTKAVFEEAKKHLWISCFSKTYKEILMWSHYGNYHKGVCIGFNYDGLSKTFDFIPSEVRYKKHFKKINYCTNERKALEYLINVKSNKWKYEKEIRLRTYPERAPGLNSKGIVSIHPNSISKIIIGCNCPINSANIKNRLLKLNFKNVELIQLSKSKNSFELDEIKL
ncbi:DUF2971 domain-containing protein [Saccharicrinis sp. FJH2]|uniref:DUF2971 domain-containing protein n=1 Tax=Saccharicrinis sp. FJH65 TaxID=3344659 RepID=UPI0035F25A86